jgi:vacuolar-type H+-ATPase subunit F/Vma7
MKLFVVGHPEAVLGFSLAGVAGRAVSDAEGANAALDEALSRSDVGIVLVTQDVAAVIQGRMDGLKLRSTLPLIVELPSPDGSPKDQPELSEIVLRAIGIKL